MEEAIRLKLTVRRRQLRLERLIGGTQRQRTYRGLEKMAIQRQ